MLDANDLKIMLSDTVDYLYPWEREAREDFRFYALKQWTEDDLRVAEEAGMPALVIDRTRPLIDSVAGSEIMNRYEAKFYPRQSDIESGDPQNSENISAVYKYLMDTGNVVHHFSHAFHSALICGVGATESRVSYDDNTDGDILTRRVPVWELGWDPDCNEPNMLDGRWVFRDRWIDYDEVQSLFGKENIEEVISIAKNTSFQQGFWGRLFSNKIRQDRMAYDQKRVGKYWDPRTRRLRLWECQYFERRYVNRLVVPAVPGIPGYEEEQDILLEKGDTQNEVEKHNASIDQFNAMNVEQGQQLPSVGAVQVIEDFPTKEYYRSWYSGEHILKTKKMQHKGFTYKFVTAFEDWSEDTGQRYFFGMMRPARDPQKYANKFFSHAIHLWASNPKGALMFEEGLFEDYEEAMKQWQSANGLIKVKDGTLQSPKPRYEHITSNTSMRGIETLLQHSLAAVPAAVGISQEYFVGGTGDLKRTAASAIQDIREANLAVLSNPFDSLKLHRKEHAKLSLGMVAAFMPDQQIIRILGPEKAAEIIQNRDELEQYYDISVGDTPQSQNEQMEVFAKMMESNMLPQLSQLGMSIPPEVAKYFPFPTDINAAFQESFGDAKEVQKLGAEVQKMQLAMQLMQGAMMMGALQQGGPEAMAAMGGNGEQPQQGAGPPQQGGPQPSAPPGGSVQ